MNKINYLYTIVNKNNEIEVEHLPQASASNFLKVHPQSLQDFFRRRKFPESINYKGYKVIRKLKDENTKVNPQIFLTFFCQNPTCATRGKEHRGKANFAIYKDYIKIKVCNSCQEVITNEKN